MLKHDVIIVGGGLAGLRSALELCDKYDTALISRVHPLRSHSIAAQGGINAALANNPDGKDDTWERHAFDTIKGSDYLADQDAVETMCREAPGIVYEMEHRGCPFSRFPDGTIAQRPFGGAGFPRTCYCADTTGHALLNTLFESTVRKKIKVYQEWFAISLAVDDGVCCGVMAFDPLKGETVPIAAGATLFATGGYGRVYQYSTNALINTGSGIGMAYRAGVPLKDMEFVQFHPTGLVGTNILMSEACRGEGGILLNNKHERFMERYAPGAMELAPRDIVARSIQREIEEGRGFEHPQGSYIELDLRHLGAERIRSRLPGIRSICIDFAGIDPIRDAIPIMPCQHYSMGGIDTDSRGVTEIEGFFAAGECACVSVHGANRLGGNSLLEAIVFGKLTGGAIDEFLASGKIRGNENLMKKKEEEAERKLARLAGGGPEKPFALRRELEKIMSQKVGIFRTKDEVLSAVEEIETLKERYLRAGLLSAQRRMNYELIDTLELEYMLDVAQVIATQAHLREESRGAHYRRDFTGRNDTDWLRHSIARIGPDSLPVIASRAVVITRHEPQERAY